MKNLIILFLIIICSACKRETQPIIQADLKPFEKQINSGNALTQEDVNRIMSDLQNEIRKNTVGKSLPSVNIENLHGKNFDLVDLIKKRSIIIFTDSHCGFGIGSTTKDFPEALNKLKKQHRDYDVFCIVIKSNSDSTDTISFNSLISELKPIYANLYLMNETDSQRLNIYGFPTHFLVDNHKIVVSYRTGMAMVPNLLYDELDKFLTNYK